MAFFNLQLSKKTGLHLSAHPCQSSRPFSSRPVAILGTLLVTKYDGWTVAVGSEIALISGLKYLINSVAIIPLGNVMNPKRGKMRECKDFDVFLFHLHDSLADGLICLCLRWFFFCCTQRTFIRPSLGKDCQNHGSIGQTA